MKLLDISGNKRMFIRKLKWMNWKLTVRKSIRDLYRDINNFKKVYQLRTNAVKHEKGYLVTDATVFWLGGGTISLKY